MLEYDLEIWKRLLAVQGGTRLPPFGICYHLKNAEYSDRLYREHCREFLRSEYKRWSDYSGYESYPVPHPEYPVDGTEEDMAVLYAETDDMWIGEYGAARLRLVDFLLAAIEARIAGHTKANAA